MGAGAKLVVAVQSLSERREKSMSEQTTDDGRRQQDSRSPLQTELGITTIQDGVVSKVAGIAAQEVEGVRMGSGGTTSQAVGAS